MQLGAGCLTGHQVDAEQQGEVLLLVVIVQVCCGVLQPVLEPEPFRIFRQRRAMGIADRNQLRPAGY